MKICTKCNSKKEETAFSWRNAKTGKRQSWCKECRVENDKATYLESSERRKKIRDSNTQRQLRNAQYVWDYLLAHPCVKCGEADPIVLDFDHTNPEEKSEHVSTLTHYGASLKVLQTEISKCDVLCANCHRRRTAVQMNWYKGIDRRQQAAFVQW